MSDPRLAALLVVRDEVERLPEALAGLIGLVDEIIVHDTGSRDGTVAVARAAGAVVHQGYWDDDFARARNVGLDTARAPWVLVIDADERVARPSDRRALLTLLARTSADVLTVSVRNVCPEELGGSYRHPGPRLLRRDHVRYLGRVHEQPVSRRGRRTAACPREVLSIDHLGYADAAVLRAKAARNAAIAAAELERLGADSTRDRSATARALLALGRSLVVGDRRPQAVDAFVRVRELAPGTRLAVEATDALARVLLGAGDDRAVLGLAEELRTAGVDGRYCDWLRAQAKAQLGAVPEALALLRGIDTLVDPACRELDRGQVLEVRSLVARLAGATEESARCLAEAMVRHGRVTGRGQQLLDLWGERPVAELAELLRAQSAAGEASAEVLTQVAAELAGCRTPGAAVAAELTTPRG